MAACLVSEALQIRMVEAIRSEFEEIFLLKELCLFDIEINSPKDETSIPVIKVSAQTFLYSKPIPRIRKILIHPGLS
mgnify:CR=1 FL=1